MRTGWLVSIVAIAGLGGYLLGTPGERAVEPPAALASASAPTIQTVVAPSRTTSVTPDEIEAIVRRVLHERDGSEQPAEEPPAPPSAETLAAREEARSVMDRVLAARRWTEADRAALHRLQLRDSEAMHVELRRLVVAINAQRIRMEAGLP